MNILTRGFLGSLIMNLIFVFRKTKWRAIDTNFDYLKKNHDSRVLGAADHESDTGFSKTEWRFKNSGWFLWIKIFLSKKSDYESDIGFSNQEIADRKWR